MGGVLKRWKIELVYLRCVLCVVCVCCVDRAGTARR